MNYGFDLLTRHIEFWHSLSTIESDVIKGQSAMNMKTLFLTPLPPCKHDHPIKDEGPHYRRNQDCQSRGNPGSRNRRRRCSRQDRSNSIKSYRLETFVLPPSPPEIRPFKLLINFPDVEFITNPGTIVGCDFAGTVVRVGKNVTSVAAGDRVAGCTHGGRWKDIGAFAEYTKTPAELVWKVPSSLSQEQAATMNCGWVYRL